MNNIELSRIALFFNDLIVPISIGYYLKKHANKYLLNKLFQINQKHLDKLLLISMFILKPFITTCALWKIKLEISLIYLPVIGLLMQIIPGIIGIKLATAKYKDPLKRGSYILSSMFANRSIIGILSVFIIFGEQGYAYARLTMLFGAPTYYIFGFALAKYYFEKSNINNTQKINIKKIILNKNQIPVIGIILGIILNIQGISRPQIANSVIPFLVHLSTWLVLIPLGFSINLRKINCYIKDALEISTIRFLLIPVIIYFIANYLGLKGIIFGTLIILSLTPASVGAVIAAKLHKLNTHLPMAVYLISSLIYLVLIYPLIILFCG